MKPINRQIDVEMEKGKTFMAAVIVAHPDDETIWAGGMVLAHSDWQWTIVSLCRGSDLDRAPRFTRAVQELGAVGKIGDLDDGPGQPPLPQTEVPRVLLSLLPEQHFGLLLTHSPYGEYTRHRRHEETSRAVAALWEKGLIRASEVWMFAYEDDGKGGRYDLPRPIKTAHRVTKLPENIWQRKHRIITEVYGFGPDSFEARAALREEAFWCFSSAGEFHKWLVNNERRKQ